MYRAYLLDDEPLVLDGFINTPVFLECGYHIAGYAYNPFTAMNEIKRINPDVIFTDLIMPGCTGIEFMEEMKRRGGDYEFVMVSAYSEFEEARRFFTMDGFDYLVKPVSERELAHLLGRLSGKIASKKSAPAVLNDTPSPELNKMTAYLRENLSMKHSLESLGQMYQVNQNYICNLFARYMGTTFVSYMTKLRMEEAARLLMTTRLSVKEIAGHCGYGDYFYFCRVFREYYACTPTAFREASP